MAEEIKYEFTQDELGELITKVQNNIRKKLLKSGDYAIASALADSARQTITAYARKKLPISGVEKTFTAEEVVNELEEYETLDDGILFFTSQAQLELKRNNLK